MPIPVRLIQTEKVVVISPSDVKEERAILLHVIEELNRTVAKAYQVHLELWTWEMDAFPGFHELGPQGLIDELLAQEDPDIVVGIFWHKIGTPLPAVGARIKADAAATGTTHEFRAFYDQWVKTRRPHILFYFKKEPYFPVDRADLAQWDGVFLFRENLPETGFSWGFRDAREFETLARNHLAMALVRKYGGHFAKGVAIVDSEEDMKKTLLDVVAKAEKKLLTTGSRSHEKDYFDRIERAMREDRSLSYYRILFGPPRHLALKEHLERVSEIASGGERRVFLSMYDRADRQAEVSLCANESQGLIALPSFNKFGKFDSGILFTDPEKLRALRDFVDALKERAKSVDPADLEVLDEAPDPRDAPLGGGPAT